MLEGTYKHAIHVHAICVCDARRLAETVAYVVLPKSQLALATAICSKVIRELDARATLATPAHTARSRRRCHQHLLWREHRLLQHHLQVKRFVCAYACVLKCFVPRLYLYKLTAYITRSDSVFDFGM